MPPPTVHDFETSSDFEGTTPMTSSRFSVGVHSRISQNIFHFVTYTSIFSLGLASIWFCYTRVPSKHDIFARVWPLVAIVVPTLGCSILADAWISSSERTAHPSKRDVESSSLLRSDAATYGSLAPRRVPVVSTPSGAPDRIRAEDATSSRTVGNVSYEFRDGGRPDPREMVSCLMGAKTPALFVCGPKALTEGLREKVRGREFEGDCEIYEEVFEM